MRSPGGQGETQGRAQGPVRRPGGGRDNGEDGDDYLERVKRLTARLATPELAPEEVEGALAAARQVATVDVDVPTESGRAQARRAKAVVKRASSWYFEYVAAQVNDFAFALVRVAEALARRAESDRAASFEAANRLDHLEARVAALEAVPGQTGTEHAGDARGGAPSSAGDEA